MERNQRRVLAGMVVSATNDKTITVSVVRYMKHPLYGKRVKKTRKFTAHDEKNTAQVGDRVRIMETRRLSKTKRFRLLEIVERRS